MVHELVHAFILRFVLVRFTRDLRVFQVLAKDLLIALFLFCFCFCFCWQVLIFFGRRTGILCLENQALTRCFPREVGARTARPAHGAGPEVTSIHLGAADGWSSREACRL